MWKFKTQTTTIQRDWDLPTAIAMIDKWDGTLLYTSPEYQENGRIILAINPIQVISPIQGDSLSDIDKVIAKNKHIDFPFLFGYLNYDAKYLMESSEFYQNKRDTQFPDFQWTVYKFVFIFDTKWQLQNHFKITTNQNSADDTDEIMCFSAPKQNSFKISQLNSHPNKQQFINGVKRIHEYIKSGDAYQVNFTRKLTGQIEGDRKAAARALLQSNRIEFGVFYKHGTKYIISTSPERLFLTDAKKIIASPIKGTAQNTNTNQMEAEHLLKDEKNLRELAMITDLLRNDLSKVCKPTTVTVKGYPILKTLNNVFHLVADVEGEIEETQMSKIFKALFPGGSITGCPKIRACQIIEELEQKGRGPYTGSFGYITGSNTSDMNILIRTVLIENNQISFNVGGGITLLSEPYAEYEETEHKALNILNALNIKGV